jgi:alkyldihydroxyacetonephosphate synthase
VVCEEFSAAIDERGIESSMTLEDRYFRSYGQSAQDVSKDCHYRIPDIVLWPKNHEETEFIVKAANKFNVVIIPYGGESSSALVPVKNLQTLNYLNRWNERLVLGQLPRI